MECEDDDDPTCLSKKKIKLDKRASTTELDVASSSEYNFLSSKCYWLLCQRHESHRINGDFLKQVLIWFYCFFKFVFILFNPLTPKVLPYGYSYKAIVCQTGLSRHL